MTATGPTDPGDLAQVPADDALLDALAVGRRPSAEHDGDPSATLLSLLTTWRAELDDRAATSMTTALPAVLPTAQGRSRRWIRAHRRTAAATAVVFALTTSTGVAAAASGRTGPLGGLHQLLFGPEPTHHLDGAAVTASGLLDVVAAGVRSAKEAGSISRQARGRLAGELDNAKSLLDRDPLAPTTLVDRLNDLTAALAAIPVTATAPSPPATHDTSHAEVGDDNGGTDRSGPDRSGPDRSGRRDGSDDSGTDRRGGSGSDDGNAGGSDDGSSGSGDNGTDGTSGGGGRDGGSSSGAGDLD